jgi:hypothetical protein
VQLDGSRPKRDTLSRAEWAVAGLATAAALGLSLWSARHAGAFFRDEVNSLEVAAAPSLEELWRLLEFESSPALWLLLLRAWVAAFGAASDVGLRVFALLGGLALPAALWFAALRLGRAAPLVGLALVAVNPELVRWSTSLRAWGLGAALAVVAWVALREATREPSRRNVFLAALAALLSVHCVYQNAVLLAAAGAGAVAEAWLERRWRRAAVPLGVGALAALSLLVYAPTFERIDAWRMLNQVPYGPAELLVRVATRAGEVFAASGRLVAACWVLAALAALAAGVWSLRRRGGVALFASAAALAALAGFALFLLRVRYLTQPWYYVGLAAFLAACIDAALAAALPSRAGRAARLALAALVLVAGLPAAVSGLRERQTNVDAIARHLERNAARGDLIVVNPWYVAISLSRYYRGGADLMTLPPIDDVRVHRFDLIKAAMESGEKLDAIRVRAREVLRRGGRVWVVGSIAVPHEGQPIATPPPPPLPLSGWGMGPYDRAWTLQLGAILAEHARDARPRPLDVRGGRYEDVGLSVIRGWRGGSRAPRGGRGQRPGRGRRRAARRSAQPPLRSARSFISSR